MTTVDLDDLIHGEIEKIQHEFTKRTGEKPSKEDVIAAALETNNENELVETLWEKRKERRRGEKEGKRGRGVSEFDDLFSL